MSSGSHPAPGTRTPAASESGPILVRPGRRLVRTRHFRSRAYPPKLKLAAKKATCSRSQGMSTIRATSPKRAGASCSRLTPILASKNNYSRCWTCVKSKYRIRISFASLKALRVYRTGSPPRVGP